MLVTAVMVCFLLVLGGWLELALNERLTQIFITPPLSAGLALAVLIFSRNRLWPGVAAAMLVQGWLLTGQLPAALLTGLGLTVAPVTAVLLLGRFSFQPTLHKVRYVIRFCLYGCGVAAVISATLVSWGFLLSGQISFSLYGDMWWQWWQSYLLGTLLSAPLLLVWLSRSPAPLRLPPLLEGLALVIATALLLWAAAERTSLITYIPFPFMIWVAFRFGVRGVTAVSIPMIFISLLFLIPLRPFPFSLDGIPNLEPLLMFGNVLLVTGLLVGAANEERQRISMVLAQERDFATKVTQSLGQGVAVTNLAHQFVFVNAAFAHMIGYRAAELLQKTWFDVTAAADHAALSAVAPLLRQPQATHLEANLIHKNGRFIPVLITGAPRLQEGKDIGAITVITDLTQQKQVEQELRQNKDQYRELFMAAQRQTRELQFINQIETAVANRLDLPSIFQTVVETTAKTLGYDLVVLYLREGDVLHVQHQAGLLTVPDTFPTNVGVIGRVLAEGDPVLIDQVADASDYLPPPSGTLAHEICIPLRADGDVIGVLNVECRADNPLTPSDFRLMCMLGERIELGLERTRLYSALQHSEERLRVLLKHNSSSITLTDPNGRRLFTGPSHRLLWGQSPEALVGQSVFAVLHPDDVAKAKAGFQEILQKPGSAHTGVYRVHQHLAEWVWVETTVTNLLHEPSVEAIMLNTRNITQQKQAEEALRQAQKLESLGVLAGGVAHDFNNLLAALMGQISIAQMKLTPESTAVSHLEKALKAAKRAASLTQQLLAYSGRGHFQVEPVDLNQVILENLHLFQVGLPKSVTLTTNLLEPLPLVEADVAQMQQIIMNLIINGAEAIGEEGGAVQVETAVSHITETQLRHWPVTGLRPDVGQYVSLTVRDTGSGMDVQTVERIFDPFYTTKFTGRGLGLSAVQGIIRGHAGGLRVTSQPGEGTEFCVLLPAAVPKQSGARAAAAPALPGWQGTVLVIDDEDAVREMLVDMLAMHKLTVLTAVDGAGGIERFRQYQTHIDLVILDLSMPGMNGEETLARLKQIRPDVPVLLSSGYNEVEIDQRFATLEAVGFLQKPYEMESLRAALAAVWPQPAQADG